MREIHTSLHVQPDERREDEAWYAGKDEHSEVQKSYDVATVSSRRMSDAIDEIMQRSQIIRDEITASGGYTQGNVTKVLLKHSQGFRGRDSKVK